MKLLKKIKRCWKAWKATRISHEDMLKMSICPDLPHKKISEIRRELFWLCRNQKRGSWKMDATILQYFDMRLDRAGEDIHQYVFEVEMDKARNRKQPRTAYILKDKWITARYLQLFNIATTRPILYKTPFVTEEKALAIIKQSNTKKFFAKLVDGKKGQGAFIFSVGEKGFIINDQIISDSDLIAMLDGYIVEPFIEQHETLNTLYPHGVASFRIVTVSLDGTIEVILSSLFVGAGGIKTSNLHQGGLRLSINASGELDEVGIRYSVQRGRYTSHPDTGVVFKGYKIPFWEEIKELAIAAHKCFPKINSIGWDIAVSKNGPLIIEGNNAWGTVSFQYLNGPGREYMKKYFL